MVAVPVERRAGPSGPPCIRWDPCLLRLRPCRQSCVKCSDRTRNRWRTDYLTRIARIVLALRAHGVAISSGELDMLATKASLLAEEFGLVGTRPGWSGACGPGFGSQRSRKGATAMPPNSRKKSKRSVSSSLPSAAGRAPAPTRFGALLLTFPQVGPRRPELHHVGEDGPRLADVDG